MVGKLGMLMLEGSSAEEIKGTGGG